MNQNGEYEAFFAAFHIFSTDPTKGLDPNQHSNTKYRTGTVLAFARTNPVLAEFMNQQIEPKRINQKLYDGYKAAALKYLATQTEAAPAATNESGEPAPNVSNPNNTVVCTTKTAPNAPALQKVDNISFDYETNQSRFDAKYELIKGTILGKGSYSIVFLGRAKDSGGKVAIKKLHKLDRGTGDQLLRRAKAAVTQALPEVGIWRTLTNEKSPFILELLDSNIVLDDYGIPTLYTVTPYMQDGELEKYIEFHPDGTVRVHGLSEEETHIIAKQLFLVHCAYQ